MLPLQKCITKCRNPSKPPSKPGELADEENDPHRHPHPSRPRPSFPPGLVSLHNYLLSFLVHPKLNDEERGL